MTDTYVLAEELFWDAPQIYRALRPAPSTEACSAMLTCLYKCVASPTQVPLEMAVDIILTLQVCIDTQEHFHSSKQTALSFHTGRPRYQLTGLLFLLYHARWLKALALSGDCARERGRGGGGGI